MEYINKSKICREFLNQYSDTLYPELLPKLMKVAIYALHKRFHKWYFTLQELDEFINFFNYKNKNFELESNYYNNCPNPPCEEYLEPKDNGIPKLKKRFHQSDGEYNSDAENGAVDFYDYKKSYPNDDVYINEKNNFFDENYYIPRSHSFRNIQLYNKRLSNPKFNTQEKKIYPHWWWNLKDDIEQDDYSDDDSEKDHVPNRVGRFPKNIEERLKKKAKRNIRNKSFNGIRPVEDRYYDEERIFPNPNLTTDKFDSPYRPYRRREYSPSDDESRRPFGGTGYDGFERPFPTSDRRIPSDRFGDRIDDKNPQELRISPLYQRAPDIRFSAPRQQSSPLGPISSTGLAGRPGIDDTGLGPNSGMGGMGEEPKREAPSPYSPNGLGINPNGPNNPNNPNFTTGIGGVGMSGSIYGTSALKSQILSKRQIKQSTFLSYDKDFNLNGAFKKVKGQAKKGLKYSLSGNQLKEDIKGIRRRKK